MKNNFICEDYSYKYKKINDCGLTSSTHSPKEVIQKLIQLINKNLLTSAVDKAKALIKDYPNNFILWNILGITNNYGKKVIRLISKDVKLIFPCEY